MMLHDGHFAHTVMGEHVLYSRENSAMVTLDTEQARP
jgi:hypothetical protein